MVLVCAQLVTLFNHSSMKKKKNPIVYLSEQKVAVAWSHPRVIHEYTSINFRTALLCHGTVIFKTASLEQMCLKGCLMSLKCNMQVQFAVASATRAGLCVLGASFQHHEQRLESRPGSELSLPPWFCTLKWGHEGNSAPLNGWLCVFNSHTDFCCFSQKLT